MRVRLFKMSMVLAVGILMSLCVASARNANNSNGLSSATQAAAAKPAAGQKNEKAAMKPKTTHHRKHVAREAGVPMGVGACVDRLIKLSEKDPLVDYEKGPYEIINNGLLWDNPHSKCSVGNNTDLRLKISNMANAWQMKDSGKVRSMLQDIKSSVPASEEPAPKKSTARKHRTSKAKPPAKQPAASN